MLIRGHPFVKGPNTVGVVVTFANRKGGVGKTALSVTLAAGLALRAARQSPTPERILLIDLDPQSNATKTIASTTQFSNTESFAAAIADDELLDVIGLKRPTPSALPRKTPDTWYPNLYFAPSRELLLVEVRRRMPGFAKRFETTGHALDTLKKEFAYVVVDTGPAIDDLLVTALAATDYVVVPVEATEFSIEGATRVRDKVAEIAGDHSHPRILGYVANKVRQHLLGDQNAMEAMRQVFGPLLYQAVIPSSVEVPYSQSARSDVFRYSRRDQPIVAALAAFVEETTRRIAKAQANGS